MCAMKLSVRDNLRPWLLKKVEAGYPLNVSIQKAMGVTQRTPQGHFLITKFFKIAAALGTEVTFILGLPLVFWIVDTHLGVRMVALWGLTYYIGQYAKDYFQLPRPTKPVIRLEAHYDEEYGLPSTHVMGGLTVPFYVWSYFYLYGGASLWTIVFPLFWFTSISMSRLYLGVHSPMDCITGFLLGGGILWWFTSADLGHRTELWLRTAPYSLLVLWAAVAASMYIYPRPDFWVSSFGDTAVIVGALAGAFTGAAVAPRELLDDTALYGRIPLLSTTALRLTLVRFVVGSMILLATRVIVKSTMMTIMPLLLPYSSAPPQKRFAVEIPTKIMTYSAVGVAATIVAPYMFLRLNM